jgi:hypothetical protein
MAIWRLPPNEKVLVVGRPGLAAVWPRYVMTLGLYGFWHRRRVAVLTTKRVLLGKGVLSRQERSIPIRAISDAVYARKGLSGFCDISSSTHSVRSATRIGPLSARKARRLANELQGRLTVE